MKNTNSHIPREISRFNRKSNIVYTKQNDKHFVQFLKQSDLSFMNTLFHRMFLWLNRTYANTRRYINLHQNPWTLTKQIFKINFPGDKASLKIILPHVVFSFFKMQNQCLSGVIIGHRNALYTHTGRNDVLYNANCKRGKFAWAQLKQKDKWKLHRCRTWN